MAAVQEMNIAGDVVITGPSVKEEGGVANYLASILPELGQGATHLIVGNRSHENGNKLVRL
ncbi:MAG: hypothetical protein AAFP70_15540, partial [Calditrichota bacterium]